MWIEIRRPVCIFVQINFRQELNCKPQIEPLLAEWGVSLDVREYGKKTEEKKE